MCQFDLGRTIDFTDDEFVEAFESLTLDPTLFKHVDHVRLGFITCCAGR